MTKPAEQGAYRNHGVEARGRRGHRLAALLLACASLPAFAAPPVQVSQYSDRLNLDFAQAMRAWDNDVPADAVSLRPSLPLRCHWDDDTTLQCVLPQGSKVGWVERSDTHR